MKSGKAGEASGGSGELSFALQRIRQGRPVNYEGAGGSVDFDEFGNVVSNYEIWRYDAAEDAFVRTSVIQASEIQ